MIDRRAPFSKAAIKRLESLTKPDSAVSSWDSVLSLAMYEDPRRALAYLQIVLPSDPDWRNGNYQRLVDMQRALNAMPDSNRKPAVSPEPMDGLGGSDGDKAEDGEKEEEEGERDEEEEEEEEEELTKRPRSSAAYSVLRSDVEPSKTRTTKDPKAESRVFWSSADLLFAANLLSKPSKAPVSLLKDPEQMRRVYKLIYDVLRYKPVLSEALDHLNFMSEHPELKGDIQLICLFFYNLYRKEFRFKEPVASWNEDKKFQEVNDLVWKYRVRLGAIVSRMRIAREAYDLRELLPQHLIDGRSKVNDSIVCGWINFFKAKPRDIFKELDASGLSHLPEGGDDLHPLTYKLDHVLPRFLHTQPNSREQFTCSSLFIDNKVIMQERTFCLGPASVAQLLIDLALTGVVAQTHVSSLVTVAYLANLLATNEKVDGLIVFGAGNRKELCEEYLQALGVTNTTVHADSFSKLSADSEVLANVVSVLATPPNTNSNVIDPVDLAVTRGDDLELLQQLTDENFHSSGHGQVVYSMLDEQRDTLRMSMSKPQIQFVVYETHSRYDLENSEMVVRVITEMNGYATEKHLEEQRKRRYGQAEEMGSSVDLGVQKPEEDQLSFKEPEELTINVPACDLFELSPLPDLCPHRDECLKLDDEGTYIAVLKRKEITRLDPKYMIQMAESRGLFGNKSEGGGRRTTSREHRRKAAMKMQRSNSGSDSDRKDKSKIKVELNRIAAPTHSSTLRDVKFKSKTMEDILCPRHRLHISNDGSYKTETRARVWWKELSEFVLELIRDNVDLLNDPDLPRLRLTKPKYRPVLKKRTTKQRSPFPMHVNYIEFQTDSDDSSDSDDDILRLCPCLASVLTSAPASLFTAVS